MKLGIMIVLLMCLAGCGAKTERPTPPPQATKAPASVVEPGPDLVMENPETPVGDRVDLTILSSTMVYAEVYNMMGNPQDYKGKVVKMTGQFWSYEAEETGAIYVGCVIMDATACCQQGIEFVLADSNLAFPEDYPQEGDSITVEGEFQTYEEDGKVYCHLVDATMEVEK